MTKTTAPADAEAWADAQPIRYSDTRRPYIPLGCDQQGRVTPTMLLYDAKLAPAEELQAEPRRSTTPQAAGELAGTIVGFTLVLLAVIAGVSWLTTDSASAFFTWAGKTLAALF